MMLRNYILTLNFTIDIQVAFFFFLLNFSITTFISTQIKFQQTAFNTSLIT